MAAADYLLSLGIQPGDRVAVQLPKCLPFIYFHLATVQIGAVFLPLNPAYPSGRAALLPGRLRRRAC